MEADSRDPGDAVSPFRCHERDFFSGLVDLGYVPADEIFLRRTSRCSSCSCTGTN
jgi:hypothetical protein